MRDINFQYGYGGSLYVGFYQSTAPDNPDFTGDYDRLRSPGIYKILKLEAGTGKETVFSCHSMGFPFVIPCKRRKESNLFL